MAVFGWILFVLFCIGVISSLFGLNIIAVITNAFPAVAIGFNIFGGTSPVWMNITSIVILGISIVLNILAILGNIYNANNPDSDADVDWITPIVSIISGIVALIYFIILL